MNGQSTAAEIIRHEIKTVCQVTGVDDTEVTFIDSGWDSRVYKVSDGTYYFKFPRSEKVRSRYANETFVLEAIRPYTDNIVVPTVAWQGPDNAYVGYGGVAGVPLNDVVGTLDSEQKNMLGERLGRFLHTLHGLHATTIRTVTLDDEIDQLERFSVPALEAVESQYGQAAADQLRVNISQRWPDALRKLGSALVVSHGDFHGGNILFNRDSMGVIDFGDSGLYDESKDFVGLSDRDLFEAAVAVYGDSEQLRAKIRIRRKIFQVIKVSAQIQKYGADYAGYELGLLYEIIG